MLYLVLLSTLAVGFYAGTNICAQVSRNERNVELGRAAADAGMQYMRSQLGGMTLPYGTNSSNLMTNVAAGLATAMNGTTNMAGSTVQITNGTIYIPSKTTWITVDPTLQTKFQAAITQNGSNLVVTVHGSSYGVTSRGIQLQYQAAPYSLIGLSSITMKGSAYTDSYDATKGTYVQASAHHAGSIASNGNIVLSNLVKVDGASRAGVGKVTSLQNSATVTGFNAPLTSAMSYASVTLPATYTTLPDINMSSGTQTVAGGVYLVNNIALSGTAHITWQGPTTLYIKSSYSVTQSVIIDTYGNLPANRTLYFLPTCSTATWSGTNVCIGTLYAPDTDFTISGGVELSGRILARSINNSSTGGMHSDESLPPAGVGGYVPVQGTYIEVP